MSTITKFIFIAALLLSIVVPTAAFLIGEKNRGRFKTTLGINCFLFFGTMAFAVIMIFTGDGSVALAADTASASASGLAAGMGYLAAALVTGLSCICVFIKIICRHLLSGCLQPSKDRHTKRQTDSITNGSRNRIL